MRAIITILGFGVAAVLLAGFNGQRRPATVTTCGFVACVEVVAATGEVVRILPPRP